MSSTWVDDITIRIPVNGAHRSRNNYIRGAPRSGTARGGPDRVTGGQGRAGPAATGGRRHSLAREHIGSLLFSNCLGGPERHAHRTTTDARNRFTLPGLSVGSGRSRGPEEKSTMDLEPNLGSTTVCTYVDLG